MKASTTSNIYAQKEKKRKEEKSINVTNVTQERAWERTSNEGFSNSKRRLQTTG